MQLCNTPMFGAQPWPGGTYEDLYYEPDASVPGGYKLVVGSQAKVGIFEESAGTAGGTVDVPTVAHGPLDNNGNPRVVEVAHTVTIAPSTRQRTFFFVLSHVGQVGSPQGLEFWDLRSETTLTGAVVSVSNPWLLGTEFAPTFALARLRSTRTEETYAGAFDLAAGSALTIATQTWVGVDLTKFDATINNRAISMASAIRGIWFE